MKNKILLFAIILFGIGCSSGTNDSTDVVAEEFVDSSTTTTVEEPAITVTTKPSLWTVEYEEQSKSEKLRKPEDAGISKLTATDLVNVLNENFSDVQLKLKKISHDTIFVEIPDSKVFTQQMGSTGSYNYMATTVYNLTELENVKFVKFEFKGGDHAAPGVFTREDFKVLR